MILIECYVRYVPTAYESDHANELVLLTIVQYKAMGLIDIVQNMFLLLGSLDGKEQLV